jgi:hydrogenase expression/formation protein HypC
MCLGVPGRLTAELQDHDGLPWGLVEFAGVRHWVCLACVPDARPDEYVLVHAGIALTRIDEVEAQRLLTGNMFADDDPFVVAAEGPGP